MELFLGVKNSNFLLCFALPPGVLPAVGRPTHGVEQQEFEDDDEADEAEDDEKDADLPLPEVGQGRGSGHSASLGPDVKQPVVYHELPLQLWQGQMHAQSGSMIIDLTPQTGRLAKWCAVKRIGYVAVCHTDFQRDYIYEGALKEVMDKLADPASEIGVPKFINAEKKEPEKKEPLKRKDPEQKPKPKPAEDDKANNKAPAAVNKAPANEGKAENNTDDNDEQTPSKQIKLSPALTKLLAAATAKTVDKDGEVE